MRKKRSNRKEALSEERRSGGRAWSRLEQFALSRGLSVEGSDPAEPEAKKQTAKKKATAKRPTKKRTPKKASKMKTTTKTSRRATRSKKPGRKKS